MKSWNGDSWRDKDVMVMSSSATVSVFATSPPIDRPALTDEYNTNTIKIQYKYYSYTIQYTSYVIIIVHFCVDGFMYIFIYIFQISLRL